MLRQTKGKYVGLTCIPGVDDARFETVVLRGLELVVMVSLVMLFAACSYLTDFAVLNDSDQPIEVRYKVKRFPGTFVPPVAPATIASSQLTTKGNQPWNKLSSDQYQLDEQNRTVVIRVMPHQALLIANMHNYAGHGDAWDAKEFPIEEIALRSAGNEMKFVGQQARTAFSEVSRALYTLTYK
jgi:hypothetical protein